jgi:hypothetical protein
MNVNWEDGFAIRVKAEAGCVLVSANREGLRSLAGILLSLAEEPRPGTHIHLDAYNSLEDGSDELILEKLE